MSRLNRKVEYALMALKRLTEKKPCELTTAKEVSETLRTPFDATARVMQIMASHGLLRSEHGASGGYKLEKDLSQVSLLELVEMIEGPQTLVKCNQAGAIPCEIHATCNIASPLSSLNEKLNGFYDSISLHELLVSPSARASLTFDEPEVLHG